MVLAVTSSGPKRRSGSRRDRAARVIVALVAATLPACGSSGGVLTCGEIPEGGCPAGRGGSCDDVTCSGLYDCVEGEWTEVTHCESDATAATTVAASGGTGGGGEGGGCDAPEIDHAGERHGCTPDLLEPDCPAVAAEVCSPCETGCADFFLCTEGGWVDVAACEEDGTFVIVPR